MIKLVIIADDLTGALDTGVKFAKKSMSVVVTQNLEIDYEKIFYDKDVVVIDTESRHISKEEARKRIETIISKFSKKNIEFFYKKIDSTLRGNIGSELEAFVKSLEINNLPLIPAFPLGKRIVKNGILYVDGIKLEHSPFANDILNPIVDSYIPAILNQQSELQVEEVDVDNFELSKDFTKKIYLFNSENEDDLNSIGSELFNKGLLNYTAGSAGFAEVLAKYIATNSQNEEIIIEDKRIFFICGSVNIVSLQQCEVAEKIGYLVNALKFEDIVSEIYPSSNSYVESRKNIARQFAIANKVLLKTSDSKNVIENALDFCKMNDIPIEKLTKIIANNTGKLVASVVKENNIKNLIVFGGDTLIGILTHMDTDYILPIQEILPGVVLTKVILKNNTYIYIITKAGGFGEKGLIRDLTNFFNVNSRSIS